jgi:hypothetical protein
MWKTVQLGFQLKKKNKGPTRNPNTQETQKEVKVNSKLDRTGFADIETNLRM